MFSAETRIGLGAAIFFSWLSVSSVLDTGGGVLSRGTPKINEELISKKVWLQTKGIQDITPLLSKIISKYDFVIHGPFIPSFEASAATI